MTKINDFEYENNGVVILFAPKFSTESGVQKYSFSVRENDELTQKLLSSVSCKIVNKKSIEICAKALFGIIADGAFSELTSGSDISKLFDLFKKAYDENPLFLIKDLSTENRSLFSAKILRIKESSEPGEGRTKQEARVQALKNLLS